MILEIALNKPNVEKGSMGIIGESPSKTARSPKVWNYVYKELGWNKTFHAFDLTPDSLEQFAEYARNNLEGFSVTMPYKEIIIQHLDDLDERAQFIGAVNFVRNEDGRLKGYNTDGEGALKAMYYGDEPFIDTLEGKKVALIGAGGAAKAIAAFVLTETPACIDVYNRSLEKGSLLSEKISRENIKSKASSDGFLSDLNYDLIINASTKGQAGFNKRENDYYSLEMFSALAEARLTLSPFNNTLFFLKNNLDNIKENNSASLDYISESNTPYFFDAVHTPQETVMLQHARWFGRKTMNGKLMNVLQAVEGFVKVYPETEYNEVLELMKKV